MVGQAQCILQFGKSLYGSPIISCFSVHSLEGKLQATESQKHKLTTQVLEEQQKTLQSSELIKRLKRKLLLVSKVSAILYDIVNQSKSNIDGYALVICHVQKSFWVCN